jgi:hypothetical protein
MLKIITAPDGKDVVFTIAMNMEKTGYIESDSC